MVTDPAHYQGLAERRRDRTPASPPAAERIELTRGPGVGLNFVPPIWNSDRWKCCTPEGSLSDTLQ
jgi:hypothetical protein